MAEIAQLLIIKKATSAICTRQANAGRESVAWLLTTALYAVTGLHHQTPLIKPFAYASKLSPHSCTPFAHSGDDENISLS